jgi:DNA-binding SARP family transcriptional activator
MEIRILGPVEVLVDGRRLRLGGQRARVLLAVLALEANRVVPVDRLIEALWDDDPPVTARAQVQICVSALRRSFAEGGVAGCLGTRAPGYLLTAGPGELDAVVFEEHVARARRLTGDGRVAEAADALRAGLSLWRGRALAGMPGRFVESRALRLDDRRLSVLEERIRLDLALGRHAELVGERRVPARRPAALRHRAAGRLRRRRPRTAVGGRSTVDPDRGARRPPARVVLAAGQPGR